MNKTKSLLIFSMILFSFVTVFAQTGTIKIFSEVKDIYVYVDEIMKGIDIKEITEVQKGTHYLKIVKESITIYEQIVLVEENSITSIVLKDSPDIANKLLANKKNETAEYDSLKLSVDNNMNFYRGNKNITLKEFAIITDNREIVRKIDKNYSTSSMLANTGAVTMILGLVGTGLTFSNILLGWPDFPDGIVSALPIIGTVSIVTCLAGYVMTNGGSANMAKAEYGLITFEEAQKAIDKHNSDLKIKLGLPENYK